MQATSSTWRERWTEPRLCMPSGLVYIRRNASVLRRRRGDAGSLFANCVWRDRCEPPRNGAWEGETLCEAFSVKRVVNALDLSGVPVDTVSEQAPR
jgi:hypothetical protein